MAWICVREDGVVHEMVLGEVDGSVQRSHRLAVEIERPLACGIPTVDEGEQYFVRVVEGWNGIQGR